MSLGVTSKIRHHSVCSKYPTTPKIYSKLKLTWLCWRGRQLRKMCVWQPREAEAESGSSAGCWTQGDWAGGQGDVWPRGPGLSLDRGQLTRLPEQLGLDGLEAAEDGVMGGPGVRGRGPGQQGAQVARVTRPRPLQQVGWVLGVPGECLYPGQRQRGRGARRLQLGQRGHGRGRGYGGTLVTSPRTQAWRGVQQRLGTKTYMRWISDSNTVPMLLIFRQTYEYTSLYFISTDLGWCEEVRQVRQRRHGAGAGGVTGARLLERLRWCTAASSGSAQVSNHSNLNQLTLYLVTVLISSRGRLSLASINSC